jgi:UrcA family protein
MDFKVSGLKTKEQTMRIVKTAAAALAFFALGAGAALADQRSVETRTVEISTAAFNLADPVEIDALHRDIVRSARSVCGEVGRASAREISRRNGCVRKAVDAAVQTASINPLSVLHANLVGGERYAAVRAAPGAALMTMVAEAAIGQSGSAGQVAPSTTR